MQIVTAFERRHKPTPKPMKNPSYIPAKDSLLAAWLLNFATRATASPATYGLTAPDALAITGVKTAFANALTIATDPSTRTPASIAAKDAAKASALAVVRPFAVSVSMNAAVTNENKVAIGVTDRSATPTPIPAPAVAPDISLLGATPLNQQLQIKPVGASNKAKPAGCVAIELARSVGTVAATDPAQLSIVGQFGKTPLLQSFDAGDRGKVVTYAARYRTRSGPGGVSQAGPWSALTSFVVM